MHRAIEEMAKEVIRQEVVRREIEYKPGQHTRLTDRNDILHVLRDCLGTESVEGITLDYYDEMEVKVEAFKKMTNLRFIRLLYYTSSSSSNDDKSSLSFKKLKHLEWMNFPLKSLDNIDMGNVVVIKLQNSKLEILWEGFKSLKNLRILDVTLSQSLTKTGNFTGLEKLEKLCLRVCLNLEELDGSIGCLVKLKELNLMECTQLKSFPWEMIGKLTSLTLLDLGGCSKLEPEGFMKVTGLRNLHRLSMRNCNVSQVSSEIGNLVSLEYLDLSQNSFSNLPDSFSNLSKLVELKMKNCYHLQLLPLLPSNLAKIDAYQCWSLDAIRYDSVKAAYIFRSKMLEESFFTKPLGITLSGDEVPEWCSYRSNGNELSFVAPMQHLDNKICGVILCETSIKENRWPYYFPTMLNKTKETSHRFGRLYIERCSMFVIFCPLNDTTLIVEAGDSVVIEFEKHSAMSCGFRLIYESDVVDSELCIRTLTVPLEMTAAVADNDQYIYYNFFPENLSNDCFETTLVIPSEIMNAGARITELDDDDYELHL